MSTSRFSRLGYYRRLWRNYVLKDRSHLTFWHDQPAIESHASIDKIGPYYQRFSQKADYPGPFDDQGIPKLDYGGNVGVHHNPIAIAQYGLAHYNRYVVDRTGSSRSVFLAQADHLRDTLEEGASGIALWTHPFAWEYREGVAKGWRSGLAQGQAISLLVRAHAETGEASYLDAARRAFEAFTIPVDAGGLSIFEADGLVWMEEIIVDPPSHILNGYLWGSWGVYDLWLATGDARVRAYWESCAQSLARVLSRFDVGYWSLYEISPYRLPMMASPFYHGLHIVQLRIMATLTDDPTFSAYADRWERYQASRLNRLRALVMKGAFKLAHY